MREPSEYSTATESLDPTGLGKSRREFLQSAAVKGAVASLFGAMTFETVMARAMDRVGERRALDALGSGAAEDLRMYPQALVCPAGKECSSELGYRCTSFTCGPASFQCSANFTCSVSFNCTASNPGADFWCGNVFNCTQTNRCTGTYQCEAPYS